LAPNGLFMFSTFGPDTLKELRQAFTGVDDFPHVSRFADMHDIGDALLRNGFGAPIMDMEYFTLTYEDLMGLMRDLKMIGAHNAAVGRRPGLMGKAAWEKLRQAYERFRCNGKLPATYEVIYGHAWKGEEITPSALPGSGQAIRWRGR
ncbi:MAG TPA: malonyl-[acyl-carrier protein] O-methyltransferase BioC, partial [Betaproteobacteria bacterium]|nr:malonyl-[acyl-carrier protein] O-methyltransferase BioC [Betaproteobacteria bacterium]